MHHASGELIICQTEVKFFKKKKKKQALPKCGNLLLTKNYVSLINSKTNSDELMYQRNLLVDFKYNQNSDSDSEQYKLDLSVWVKEKIHEICIEFQTNDAKQQRNEFISHFIEDKAKPIDNYPINESDQISSFGYIVPEAKLDPIARILLIAAYDDDHIFSNLGGVRFILKAIWEYALDFNRHYWKECIDDKTKSVQKQGSQYLFPTPKDININMMPFIMSFNFKETKLPYNLAPYFRMIRYILSRDKTQLKKVCYLTIQESFAEKGRTQRRPGLHVENPGQLNIKSSGGGQCNKVYHPPYNPNLGTSHPWGRGHYENKPVDGIYMASSVDGTCAIWDCQINDKAIGHLGDIEHLRYVLNEYNGCKKTTKWAIYWLTDRTPHESLPMLESGYRQFFRLVTHKVSVWYEQHSTPNPNGVIPDEKITQIIKKNKFE